MTKKYLSLVLLLLLLLHTNQSRSQPYYFMQYQVEEGLSNNAVFCSMQDASGFMWFGTRDGLNRFDGYSFKVYLNDFRTDPLIQSNFIRALQEDQNRKIWIGTDQGIYIFDPVKEKSKFFRSSITGEILDIKKDAGNNIWFICDLTLYKYELLTDSLIRVSNHQQVTTFCLANDKRKVWIANLQGEIVAYSRKGSEKERYRVFNKSSASVDKRIEKIYCISNNRVLIGTRKEGIKLFNANEGSCETLVKRDYKNESLFVRDILQYNDSQYWFATESGIVVYDISTGDYRFVRKEKESPWALSDDAVYTLCQDNAGGIWAGTYFGGVNYYAERNNFFEKFQPKSLKNSISGYAVREIVEDSEGNLWIGTEDNGLNKYVPQENRFYSFLPDRKPGSIAHSNIHGLLVSGDTLWIGTFEHGLDLLNIKTGKVFKHYDGNEDGTSGINFVFNIMKTSSGDILLATSMGLYRFNPRAKTFELYDFFPGHIFYTSLFEDKKKNIWAATWRDGLYYYNPVTKKAGTYLHDPSNVNTLRSNRINRVFEDSKNNLWIATEGGLSKLNPVTDSLTHYTVKNGFPSNLILSMLEDKDGLLWISTAKGMVRFDPQTNEAKILSKQNGLLSDQFNYNSSFADSRGNFYFGSVKGLVRFKPANFPKDRHEPPVYLTGLQIQNEDAGIDCEDSPLKAAITYTKEIVLRHNQSSFSIDFAALNYHAPGMTEYAYKMDGIDKEWNYLKTNNKVYFTNVAPGNYRFRVRAVNTPADFTGKETVLLIEVTPPFWKSTLAYILYTLVVTFIIFFAIKAYDRKIKEKNRRRLESMKHQREKSLYKAKIDFYTLIAHEIRTPLTLIKAPLEKAMGNTIEDTTVQKHLRLIEKSTNRLVTLSNQLLDFRKAEVRGFGMNFKRLNITDLVQEICNDFRPSLENREYLRLETSESPVYGETDEEALIKILTNLIDNALKYSRSFVRVTLDAKDIPDDPAIVIRITNDGAVIPQHLKEMVFKPFYRLENETGKRGTGLGLALSRSLTELLNGSLELSNGTTNTNTFTLILPQIQPK